MRIINIILTRHKTIEHVESFGVFEDQLESDVVDAAESYFAEQASLMGFDDDTIDDAIEDGHIEDEDGNAVDIIWSDI